MRTFSLALASVLAFSAFGQETGVDSSAVVADSVQVPTTDLDSAALHALDERLARLDSEHLMFAFHNLPEIDTITPLPLTDSVFEHYMAELDARTPFEMAYNPVVKRYLERYLKYAKALGLLYGCYQAILTNILLHVSPMRIGRAAEPVMHGQTQERLISWSMLVTIWVQFGERFITRPIIG